MLPDCLAAHLCGKLEEVVRVVRAAAAQALPQDPGQPAGVRDGSRGAVHEQRLGAGGATERDLPQGDERLPLRVGRRGVRGGALGDHHGTPQRSDDSRSDPRHH